MQVLSWGLPALLLAFAVGFAAWIYGRRELPVPGRWILGTVRASVLVLVLLLLWNPAIPGGGPFAGDPGDAWILLDASRSMAAVDVSGERPWDRALERAREGAARGDRILAFGEEVREVPPDSLPRLRPREASSRLAPALERAAEEGARRVVVLSDLRLDDSRAAAGRVEELGLPVGVEDVGEEVRNVAVARMEMPRRVEVGEGFEAEVWIQGEGGREGDSVTVEIREGGRTVALRTVELPPPGRQSRLALELPPSTGEGWVRYVARAHLEGDGFSDDDQRVAHVAVASREEGLLLVSFRPDWEPRALLPVLERVTGLPVRGFLRLGEDRYLPLGEGVVRPDLGGDAEVRRRLEEAEVLVLHGVGADAPDWGLRAVREAPRTMVFPSDPVGARAAGIEVEEVREGEWYPAPELPASPLAGDLAGLDLRSLPPLTGLLPLRAPVPHPAPLPLIQGRRQGPSQPALLLREDGSGRRAVVLASGFWRWDAREGAPRDAYRRLWSGTIRWLLQAPGDGEVELRPLRRVVARGERVGWSLPSEADRSVDLRMSPEEDGVALDTTLTFGEDGTVETPPLPPGAYRYEARWSDDGAPAGAGSFDVESFTGELIRPRADPDLGFEPDQPRPGGGGGRPFRTSLVPYLLLLVLLTVEWVGRRRKGLR